jgi:hypothetical protein
MIVREDPDVIGRMERKSIKMLMSENFHEACWRLAIVARVAQVTM